MTQQTTWTHKFLSYGGWVAGVAGLLGASVLSPLTARAIAPSTDSADASGLRESADLLAQAPIAQATDVQVFERPSYVNTCRNSGASTLAVYTSTAQSTVVRQLQPYTRITLTGVLGDGVAQIREPAVGWVRSATLLTNCDARPPVDPVGQCYQVTQPELIVRSAPYGTILSSVLSGERIYGTNPVQRQTTADGRIWQRVYYRGTTNLGWVAETGTGGIGINFVRCP
ncbi:hypothetical protein [Thermoleptolyngbya sp. C42_A2020_037]|uniref:hypothetical protein n=1 Tax=Thermoleptolyngbya sp. C42_A2020_037 TaxID=2747799 RepID=UPI0019EB2F05|nr:hypothetical protein [Thermoleptolyngbya sp. C42_A2020_037]MBF2085764.1 hypothetical protein [Thermoleptolyngbya sp. C42_A2020_037]